MAARQPLVTWIHRVQARVPDFLEALKTNQPGFFHYTLSGDLVRANQHWGLSNTVFAVKIYHLLDQLRSLEHSERTHLADFINSFRHSDGTYFDPTIRQRARLTDLIQAVHLRQWAYARHRPAIMAETRQAIAAEHLLGYSPSVPAAAIPTDTAACDHFIAALPWHQPWAAGSHLSHLLFFLQHSSALNRQACIAHIHRWVQDHQRLDGTWGQGTLSRQQKINGAMKVLTGLAASGSPPLKIVQPLIDLCLSAAHNEQACDHVDIVYVIAYARRQAPRYRAADIQRFAQTRLEACQRHYFPAYGGFSFYPGRANDRLFGARISRGRPEPDIHGTLIFLWTLSLLVPLLHWEDAVRFNALVGQ